MSANIFSKLDVVLERFAELENQLTREGLDSRELTRVSRERANLEPVVIAYKSYRDQVSELAAARDLLAEGDSEMRVLAAEEISRLEAAINLGEQELRVLTLPKDPNDERNVILEIRAGTGGEEAALFAGDLFRMYSRYAEKQGWGVEIMSMTEAQAGGLKEVISLLTGQAVYSRLKFEAGVHRVQRVPATEAQGRVHTSACTVAILPEAEEVDVHINPVDLEITTSRASGAGGQHVNKTDSAIRIVHKPTGLVVECQDERSQQKNRERAMKVLKSRLLEKAQREQQQSIAADRKSQVGSGDRSERIRTYNFPQGRMTDHRINLTLYKLDEVINGDLREVLEALASDYQATLLSEELERV